jgi:hypothetical protein
VAISFIGGGNRRNQRKPPTCRKSLINFIIIMLYTSPWSRFELTTWVVIDTDVWLIKKSSLYSLIFKNVVLTSSWKVRKYQRSNQKPNLPIPYLIQTKWWPYHSGLPCRAEFRWKKGLLFWNGMQGNLEKGCLETTMRYDSMCKKDLWQCHKNYAPWPKAPYIFRP